jgi:hypothetical protein
MRLSTPKILEPVYFAFCDWDVIDSTIMTFADSRSHWGPLRKARTPQLAEVIR